jgi:hypothetical protein
MLWKHVGIAVERITSDDDLGLSQKVLSSISECASRINPSSHCLDISKTKARYKNNNLNNL